MRGPSWFGRRFQCCARCGGHLFEYFFSPDGRFGLVNVLDMLLDGENAQPVRTQMRHIVTADFREPAYRLIRRLRAARVGLAAVVDRERQLIGIATAEELVKRLVQSA